MKHYLLMPILLSLIFVSCEDEKQNKINEANAKIEKMEIEAKAKEQEIRKIENSKNNYITYGVAGVAVAIIFGIILGSSTKKEAIKRKDSIDE